MAQAAVSDIATPKQRARLFGLLGAAFGLGFVGGPALAGAAAAIVGPRLPFYVAAALAGVNAVTAVRRLPETRRPGATAPAPSGEGAVRLVAPLVALAFVALVAFSGFEAGTIRAGLLANVVGLVVLAAVHSFTLLVPDVLSLTVGQGLLSPTLSSAVVGRIGPERRGGRQPGPGGGRPRGRRRVVRRRWGGLSVPGRRGVDAGSSPFPPAQGRIWRRGWRIAP